MKKESEKKFTSKNKNLNISFLLLFFPFKFQTNFLSAKTHTVNDQTKIQTPSPKRDHNLTQCNLFFKY